MKYDDNTLDLEIVFPSETEASITLSNRGGDEKFGEILVFTNYALRQMANFGGDEVSASIGSYLIEVSKNFSQFLKTYDPDAPRLVEGANGKKKFIIHSVLKDNLLNFQLGAKGFGFLGKGLPFYGPTSVFVLLRYLSEERAEDKDYQTALKKSAGLCGKAFFDREIVFETATTLPLAIANKCYAQKDGKVG